MCKIANGLSEEDITALAAHYSALPFVAARQPFDAAQAETGAALHQDHCETCHAGGQWTPYLKATLRYVPTGEHAVPRMMERELASFGNEERAALLNYYASQQD